LWLEQRPDNICPERTADAGNLPSSFQDVNRLFHPNQPLRSWLIPRRRPATAPIGCDFTPTALKTTGGTAKKNHGTKID